MTNAKIAQVITLVIAACTVVAAQVTGLGEKGLVAADTVVWILAATSAVSAFLPSVLKVLEDPGKLPPGAAAVALFVLLTPGMTGCAELQSAKQPAQEIWDAAELLCQQDLASVPDIAPVQSALALMQEVCDDLAVARPYVDLIQQYGKMSEQTRGLDPRARARSNAVAAYKARAAQK